MEICYICLTKCHWPGILEKDYQVVHREEEKRDKKPPSWLTDRYYLTDAVFLVALEGDIDFLRKIEWALGNPVYPLFLGRRSCPPTGKLCLGIRDVGMRESLRQEAWQASPWYQRRVRYRKPDYLEIVRDAENGERSYVLRDEPQSFSQLRRQYNFRNVVREQVPLPNDSEAAISTEHDPMTLLEGYDVSFKGKD